MNKAAPVVVPENDALPTRMDRSPARKPLVAASVAAGALLAAQGAQAAIVHSGAVSITVPATTAGVYLNVVTGAFGGPGTPGWDVNPWGLSGLGFFSPAQPAGGAYVISTAATAANLPSGTLISLNSSFGSGNTANISQWTLNSFENILGFRFFHETTSQVHYGWLRLQIGETILQRTIVEYAYEGDPGQPISAGAIPEPADVGAIGAIFALAAVFLGRRRR